MLRCSKQAIYGCGSYSRFKHLVLSSQMRTRKNGRLPMNCSVSSLMSRGSIAMYQSRPFVSIPIAKDDVQVGSSVRSSSLPAANNSDISNSLLFSAAKEAERLITQSIRYKKEKTEITGRENDNGVETEIGYALKAADALLTASRPSSILADAIRSQSEREQVTCIHMAFLTLTTQCLNCIDLVQTEDPIGRSRVKCLVDRALELSRSAHELSLPFHLPLYRRLIETVANSYDPSMSLSKVILEISSWISASLFSDNLDGSLFSKAIQKLIKNGEFKHAANLIVGMQRQHDINTLDFGATTEILNQLRESVKDVLERSPGTGRRNIPEKAIADIVAVLVKSLSELPREQKVALDLAAATVGDAEMHRLIKSFKDGEMVDFLAAAMENEGDSDGDDDFSCYEDEDGNSISKFDSPLDEAIQAIVTKKVTDRKSKEKLLFLMKNTSLSNDKPSVPSTISFQVGDRKEGDISFESVEDISTPNFADDDSDWSDDCELLDMRDHFKIPDITEQVERLNGGRRLKFTQQYADIMWNDDTDEDELPCLQGVDFFGDDSEPEED